MQSRGLPCACVILRGHLKRCSSRACGFVMYCNMCYRHAHMYSLGPPPSCSPGSPALYGNNLPTALVHRNSRSLGRQLLLATTHPAAARWQSHGCVLCRLGRSGPGAAEQLLADPQLGAVVERRRVVDVMEEGVRRLIRQQQQQPVQCAGCRAEGHAACAAESGKRHQ